MKTLCILIPRSSVIQSIVDPRYLFTAINQFRQQAGLGPLFDVQLVAEERETVLADGVVTMRADRLLSEVEQADIVIIPALFGNMEEAVNLNRALVPWIRQMHAKGAEVASLCVGAFLLADTGLINGRKCSTHWGFTEQLRTLYPDVEVVDGNVVTEESRICSSGGALSYWNLLLHLVERHASREMAILAAKYFAVDIQRQSQSAFAIFQGQKSHADDAVRQIQEFIEAHVTDRLSVDDLANRVAVGRRSFERRFKKATNNSVLEYVQRVKMEAAKRSFETTRHNISEVMYAVGYTDTKAFRTVFRKITGLTPAEYRNMYNRTPAVQVI